MSRIVSGEDVRKETSPDSCERISQCPNLNILRTRCLIIIHHSDLVMVVPFRTTTVNSTLLTVPLPVQCFYLQSDGINKY